MPKEIKDDSRCWFPTKEDLKILNNGGYVRLSLDLHLAICSISPEEKIRNATR